MCRAHIFYMFRGGRPLRSGSRPALCTYGVLALVLLGVGCAHGFGESVRAPTLWQKPLFPWRLSRPRRLWPLVIGNTHVWTWMCGDPQGAGAGAYAPGHWGWKAFPADSGVGCCVWNAGLRTAHRPQPRSADPCTAPTRKPHCGWDARRCVCQPSPALCCCPGGSDRPGNVRGVLGAGVGHSLR